jgi:hypothetical protein
MLRIPASKVGGVSMLCESSNNWFARKRKVVFLFLGSKLCAVLVCFMMMRSRRRKVTEKKQDIQKSPKSLINLYSSVSVGITLSEVVVILKIKFF